MTDDEHSAKDAAFRNLAASVIAQDIVIQFLLGRWLRDIEDPAIRAEIADSFRVAIANTGPLIDSSVSEFHAELQADAAVLAREKMDNLLKAALERAAQG